jgi:hypothetical protein
MARCLKQRCLARDNCLNNFNNLVLMTSPPKGGYRAAGMPSARRSKNRCWTPGQEGEGRPRRCCAPGQWGRTCSAAALARSSTWQRGPPTREAGRWCCTRPAKTALAGFTRAQALEWGPLWHPRQYDRARAVSRCRYVRRGGSAPHDRARGDDRTVAPAGQTARSGLPGPLPRFERIRLFDRFRHDVHSNGHR